MSPNVSSFVHDLVDMARAMEQLPIVQGELLDANNTIAEQGRVIADREIHIKLLKDEIEGLLARNRDLEVQRDDAELRFLESEDRMVKVSKGLAMAREALGEADRVIAPVPTSGQMAESKSETQQGSSEGPLGIVQVPEPVYGTDWGQSADRPTDMTVSKVDTGSYSGVQDAQPISSAIEQPSAEGVSVQSDPTAASETIPSNTVSSQTVEGSNDALGLAQKPSDEVGYHNEPSPKYSFDWYKWASRMDRRYGVGWWPQRA